MPQGGYLNLKTYVVRSQNSRMQYEALKRARMPEVRLKPSVSA